MPGRLVYGERTGRYRDTRTGRFVNAATVRRDLDAALDLSGRTVARLADQLRNRQITLAQFELAMRAEIKTVQLYSAASAKGGFQFMTQADYGRVGQSVREQYRYLDRMAREIEAGLPLDGRFLQRVRGYAQSGRGLYHRTERTEKERRGFTEERNVRYAGDSCDGCIDAESRGWVPIGTLPPVGHRQCLYNCRCEIEYRKAA